MSLFFSAQFFINYLTLPKICICDLHGCAFICLYNSKIWLKVNYSCRKCTIFAENGTKKSFHETIALKSFFILTLLSPSKYLIHHFYLSTHHMSQYHQSLPPSARQSDLLYSISLSYVLSLSLFCLSASYSAVH